jgi:type II secretory pathway pseudopilin PulG
MNRKGFSLMELLVIIAIIFLLLGILFPAINAVKNAADEIVAQTNATVVVLEKGLAEIEQNKPYKIELKPALNGVNIKIYLTEIPDGGTMIEENGKTYLLWTPTTRETFKTKLITSGENIKEEIEIMVFVK